MIIPSKHFAHIICAVLNRYKESVATFMAWEEASSTQNEFWGYDKNNTDRHYPHGLREMISQDIKVKAYLDKNRIAINLRSIRQKLKYYSENGANININENFPDSLWKICQWLSETEKIKPVEFYDLYLLDCLCLYAFEKTYNDWFYFFENQRNNKQINENKIRDLIPDIISPQISAEKKTLTYRLHFFSHIRYAIWNKGVFTFDFTNFDSLKDLNDEHNFIAVEARGVFNNPEIVHTGKSKGVEEDRLFLELDFKGGGNLIRNKLKIAALISKDFSYKDNPKMFCAAFITKSSHGRYIACIEGVFIREDLVKEKKWVDLVKSYLMLKRNRFEAAEKLETRDFLEFFDERNSAPGNAPIQHLRGYWICLSKINERVLISKLHVNDYFCTELWTRIDDSTSGEPGTNNYQLCYFEFYGNHKRGVLLKGYAASHPLYPESLNAQDTEKPKEIGNLLSTFIIEIPKEKHDVLSGTFNSAIKLKDGEESLWAGPVKLLAIDEKTYEKCMATTIAMKDSMHHLRQILNGLYEHEIQQVLNLG